MKSLKNNEAARPNDIPAEFFIDYTNLSLLPGTQAAFLNSGRMLTLWPFISERETSRGISLLSVAGKVSAWVMLCYLLLHVVDVIPKSQCGFRCGWSTTDMIFVASLSQEKCREQHQNLFLAFIDLTKAFDTVNRDLLWAILSRFGCTLWFLQMLRAFHDGITAKVVVHGDDQICMTTQLHQVIQQLDFSRVSAS